MKTINVRNLQHHLRAVLDEVSHGEIVEVTRRNEIVARIVPVKENTTPEPWPDLEKRLDLICGNRRVTPPASDIIYSDRE